MSTATTTNGADFYVSGDQAGRTILSYCGRRRRPRSPISQEETVRIVRPQHIKLGARGRRLQNHASRDDVVESSSLPDLAQNSHSAGRFTLIIRHVSTSGERPCARTY